MERCEESAGSRLAHCQTCRRVLPCAFTLIGLLVVIAILAVMLLAPLSRAKMKALGMHCMNNRKQLQVAWVMYSDDNNDYIAGNHWVDMIAGAFDSIGVRSRPARAKLDNAPFNTEPAW